MCIMRMKKKRSVLKGSTRAHQGPWAKVDRGAPQTIKIEGAPIRLDAGPHQGPPSQRRGPT